MRVFHCSRHASSETKTLHAGGQKDVFQPIDRLAAAGAEREESPLLRAREGDIEQRAAKGEQTNEHKLTRWLRHLAGMAEDIFEVTVAALTGPQAAIATVARNAAARVRGEQGRRLRPNTARTLEVGRRRGRERGACRR